MNSVNYGLWIAMLMLTISACGPSSNSAGEIPGNPPAEGFNTAGSDARAIAIADRVMEAMGGREAWDNTRHICWKTFGARDLVWDKWTGNVRVDFRNMTFLINIHEDTGKVYIDGVELTEADSLKKMIQRGKGIWINDSYWLVMPFKLKDSGVTLRYMGEENNDQGQACDKLELTFEGVGNTPDNRYWVWVDQSTDLVSQWAYYRNATDTVPGFSISWNGYEKKGDILLSGNRGGRERLTHIMVFDELPEKVYRSPEKPEMNPTASE